MDREWGKVPTEEYSEDKYRSLQFYYNQQEKAAVIFCLFG